MNEAVVRAILSFQALSKDKQESLIRMISITKDVTQNPMSQEEGTIEISKSPQMSWTKNDPQVVGLV